MSRPLRLGLRPGTLARHQASRIQARLAQAGVAAELIEVGSAGETDLLPEGIDLSVLPFDELPLHLPPSLALAAIGPRAEPRDALLSREWIQWASIPSGARIGVEGPSQLGQLLRARPDLRVESRGSIEELLAVYRIDPDLAAIVIPMAVLQLLETGVPIGELLPPDLLVPVAGQGALALLARAGDTATIGVVSSAIHDSRSAACVRAERAFLTHLCAGRRDPVAALAVWAEPGESVDGWLELIGRVVSPDGGLMVEGVIAEPVHGEVDAEQLGARLAEDLVAQGALELLTGT